MIAGLFFFLLALAAAGLGVWCLWPAARWDRLRLRIGQHRADALTVRRWRDHAR